MPKWRKFSACDEDVVGVFRLRLESRSNPAGYPMFGCNHRSETPNRLRTSPFMPDFLAFSLNFPILDTVKCPSLETKPRTADTPACPDLDCGRLAQLVRAPRLHRGGRGFESLSAHQLFPQGTETIRRTPKNLEFFGVLRFCGFTFRESFEVCGAASGVYPHVECDHSKNIDFSSIALRAILKTTRLCMNFLLLMARMILS